MRNVLHLFLVLAVVPAPTMGVEPSRDRTDAVPAFAVQVEAEEIVCELPAYEVTNNGSGMFWSSGSAQMVRVGDRLFVSAFEAVPGGSATEQRALGLVRARS